MTTIPATPPAVCPTARASGGGGPTLITLPARAYPVKHATVYSDRAEVSRPVARVKIPARGTSEIKLRGVAGNLTPDSIRVEVTSNNAVIADVQFQRSMDPVEEEAEEKENPGTQADLVAALKDKRAQLKALQHSVAELVAEATLVDDHIHTLTKFAATVVKPGESPAAASPALADKVVVDPPTFFDQFLPAFETRAHDLALRKIQVRRDREKKEKQVQELSAWVSENEGKVNNKGQGKFEEVHSVVVVVQPGTGLAQDGTEAEDASSSKEESEVEVDLVISYIVPNAFWVPFYDCRVSSTRSQLQLTYAARITQLSTDPWIDTQLTLSTATVSNTTAGKPPAYDTPWFVRKSEPPLQAFAFPQSAMKKKSKGGFSFGGGGGESARMSAAAYGPTIEDDGDEEEGASDFELYGADPGTLAASATATAGAVAATFILPTLATIPTGSEGHRVNVARVDMPVDLRHVSAPKLAPAAYLVGEVTNTSEYTLLGGGGCNVFLDGSFINKSSLPLVLPQSKFSLSLGSDPSLEIIYKPLDRVTELGKSHGLFGTLFSAGAGDSVLPAVAEGSTAMHCTQRIVVKNKKANARPTLVTITDQVPTSMHQSVVVTMVDPSPALAGDKEGKKTAVAGKLVVYESKEDAEAKEKEEEEKRNKGKGPAEGTAESTGEAASGAAKKVAGPPKMYKDLGVIEWNVEVPAQGTVEIVCAYRVEIKKGFDMVGM